MIEDITRIPSGDGQTYVVTGGNHVTIKATGEDTGGAFTWVEVRALPGGGPPPHAHVFIEHFYVLEGRLQITTVRDGAVVPVMEAGAGDAVLVPGNVFHGTVNDGDSPARFLVFCYPPNMERYFAEVGLPVSSATEPAPAPLPGVAQLEAAAERWGIRFFVPDAVG